MFVNAVLQLSNHTCETAHTHSKNGFGKGTRSSFTFTFLALPPYLFKIAMAVRHSISIVDLTLPLGAPLIRACSIPAFG
jgi:hypothetical protein